MADERRAWTIRVCNWRRFQHYHDPEKRNKKGGAPPWIKLYRALLDNPQWRRLYGSAAKLLIDLWLLAGETENGELTIRLEDLAYRVRTVDDEVLTDLKVLERVEFVELNKALYQPASRRLSGRKQAARPDVDVDGDGEQMESPRADARPPKAESPDKVNGNWVTEFGVAWAAKFEIPVEGAPYPRIGRALKPLRSAYADSEMLSRWERYLSRVEGQFASPEDFAKKFGEWKPQGSPPVDTRISRDLAIRRALDALQTLDEKRIPRDGFATEAQFQQWLDAELARTAA